MNRAPFYVRPWAFTVDQWRRQAERAMDRDDNPPRRQRRRDGWVRPARTPEERAAFWCGVERWVECEPFPRARYGGGAEADGWVWAGDVAEACGDPSALAYARREVVEGLPLYPGDGGRAYYRSWPGLSGHGSSIGVRSPTQSPVLPPRPSYIPEGLTPMQEAIMVCALSHVGADLRWLARIEQRIDGDAMFAAFGLEMGTVGGFTLAWLDMAGHYNGTRDPENPRKKAAPTVEIRSRGRHLIRPEGRLPGWRPPHWIICPNTHGVVVARGADLARDFARVVRLAFPRPKRTAPAPAPRIREEPTGQLAFI